METANCIGARRTEDESGSQVVRFWQRTWLRSRRCNIGVPSCCALLVVIAGELLSI